MTGAIPAQTVISGLNVSALSANKTLLRGFPANGYCAGNLKNMEVKYIHTMLYLLFTFGCSFSATSQLS